MKVSPADNGRYIRSFGAGERGGRLRERGFHAPLDAFEAECWDIYVAARDAMHLQRIPELSNSVIDWLHALGLGWWVVGPEVNDVARAAG